MKYLAVDVEHGYIPNDCIADSQEQLEQILRYRKNTYDLLIVENLFSNLTFDYVNNTKSTKTYLFSADTTCPQTNQTKRVVLELTNLGKSLLLDLMLNQSYTKYTNFELFRYRGSWMLKPEFYNQPIKNYNYRKGSIVNDRN